MNAAAKLGAYGVILVALLGTGAAVGSAAGPIDVGGAAAHTADPAPTDAELPARGLLGSQGGYTLEPDTRSLSPGGRFVFTVTGPDGTPVDADQDLDGRELHLVVVSRDLAQYARLHPTQDDTGVWSVELPDLLAGSYRAFADFQPSGAGRYTLGVDLAVTHEGH